MLNFQLIGGCSIGWVWWAGRSLALFRQRDMHRRSSDTAVGVFMLSEEIIIKIIHTRHQVPEMWEPSCRENGASKLTSRGLT